MNAYRESCSAKFRIDGNANTAHGSGTKFLNFSRVVPNSWPPLMGSNSLYLQISTSRFSGGTLDAMPVRWQMEAPECQSRNVSGSGFIDGMAWHTSGGTATTTNTRVWPTCLALSMRPRPHNQAPIYALIKILSLNLVCLHCYKQSLQQHLPSCHPPILPAIRTSLQYTPNVCNANIFAENVWQQLFALPDSRLPARYPDILPRPVLVGQRRRGGGHMITAFNAGHKDFHILFGWIRSQKPSAPSLSADTENKKWLVICVLKVILPLAYYDI